MLNLCNCRPIRKIIFRETGIIELLTACENRLFLLALNLRILKLQEKTERCLIVRIVINARIISIILIEGRDLRRQLIKSFEKLKNEKE